MNNSYKPMLAQSVDKPFNSEDWLFEIKWDGIRAISYNGQDLSIRSRNGKELKTNFPELSELASLASDTVLDGEIVLMKEGKADFQALMQRARTSSARETRYAARGLPVTYVVFDMLEKKGQSLVTIPLTERKRLLAETVKESKHVVLCAYVVGEGEAYYEAALKFGVEGIVAKKERQQLPAGSQKR